MKDDVARLQDILEAVAHIERNAVRGREEFEGDELVQVGMVHHIQIMGEAVRSLSETLRESHLKCRGRKSAPCGTFWSTNTSRLISKKSGPRCSGICPDSSVACNRF